MKGQHKNKLFQQKKEEISQNKLIRKKKKKLINKQTNDQHSK